MANSDREPIVLSSTQIAVTIDPERGADIVSVVDVATEVDVMFRAPWNAPGAGVAAVDSEARWLAGYRGGWQVLCPNAGSERQAHDTTWGFHGEAALVPWRVRERSESRVRLDVELFTAPLLLAREVAVEGRRLHLTETLTNLSTVELEVMWVHHPAFGPPLVGPGCVIRSGARTLISDERLPGTVLPADRILAWPPEVPIDTIESADPAREVNGCLTDFDEGWFSLFNGQVGLGVEVRWDAETFPHAWIWQELHATSGFPWYRRADVIAIEPGTTIPGSGRISNRPRGRGIQLRAGERREIRLVLSLFDDERDPRRPGPATV
ncbi:aldose 1-epimerase [Jiangella muralis]|uniref:aldose 1-epimerase n=1 Tax=Jiangella muralis TaxID=702383 RepID=UPI00069ECBCD|nr:aldose 1-epimerase [Jiangella muralis]